MHSLDRHYLMWKSIFFYPYAQSLLPHTHLDHLLEEQNMRLKDHSLPSSDRSWLIHQGKNTQLCNTTSAPLVFGLLGKQQAGGGFLPGSPTHPEIPQQLPSSVIRKVSNFQK